MLRWGTLAILTIFHLLVLNVYSLCSLFLELKFSLSVDSLSVPTNVLVSYECIFIICVLVLCETLCFVLSFFRSLPHVLMDFFLVQFFLYCISSMDSVFIFIRFYTRPVLIL